jgi:GMP synthase-like glutamine amidotransferase
LPDIVLATVSVDAIASTTSSDENVSSEPCIDNGTPSTSRVGGGPNFVREVRQPSAASVGLQYGTLVSCIDFGGQLGALLAGPLVAFMGTSRENGWAQLDTLQLVNSAMMLLSISLILLLIRSR